MVLVLGVDEDAVRRLPGVVVAAAAVLVVVAAEVVVAAVVVGGMLSLAMEIAQASIAIRVPSLTDLSLNATVVRAYRARVEGFKNEVESWCKKHAMPYAFAASNADFEDFVFRTLRVVMLDA